MQYEQTKSLTEGEFKRLFGVKRLHFTTTNFSLPDEFSTILVLVNPLIYHKIFLQKFYLRASVCGRDESPPKHRLKLLFFRQL